MPKKRKKRRKPHRPPTQGRKPGGKAGLRPVAPASTDEPDLLLDVQEALRGESAHGLLVLASTLLSVTDPRQRDPFAGDSTSELPRGQLVESFLAVDRPETTALLTAIAPMLEDEVTARRIHVEVARRSHRLPDRVTGLAPIEVGTPTRISHVLGDSDTFLVPFSTHAGETLTVLVHVDHNMGTIVADAFVAPLEAQEVIRSLREAVGNEPDTTFAPADPADTRAVVTEAIADSAITYPPLETATWPACRPIVEWVVGQLPAGGAPWPRPDWSDADRDALAERFLSSPHGSRHRSTTARDQLDWLMWFGCDYGPGDPLLWSPVKVEIVLLDWVPRKIIAPAEDLLGLTDVLRDLVRFGHDEAGIRAGLTKTTLAAVDDLEADYRRIVSSPRPQGPEALLAAMPGFEGLGDDELAAWPAAGPVDDVPWQVLLMIDLAEQVGGPEELEALDATPLPDEPFDLGVVSDDPRVSQRVSDVLALLDGANDEFFDLEHRTACRRLLADLAAADPKVLLRGRAETAAAALVWLIAKANDSFGSYSGGVTVGEVTDWFGISATPSQRASTILRALGIEVPWGSASWAVLGSARYLTGPRRESLAAARDHVLELIDQTG